MRPAWIVACVHGGLLPVQPLWTLILSWVGGGWFLIAGFIRTATGEDKWCARITNGYGHLGTALGDVVMRARAYIRGRHVRAGADLRGTGQGFRRPEHTGMQRRRRAYSSSARPFLAAPGRAGSGRLPEEDAAEEDQRDGSPYARGSVAPT